MANPAIQAYTTTVGSVPSAYSATTGGSHDWAVTVGWNYQKPDHMANLVTAFRHLAQAVLELETLLRG